MRETLKVEHLSKSYGGRAAVVDVSFELQAGKIVGLLGPNGAGKSTTIGIISGLVEPDGGTIALGGEAWRPRSPGYKRRVGIVPQDLAIFEDLRALDNLELFGALYDVPRGCLRARALEVLAQVGLAERARDRPATFSGGMKRRLNIACALMHEPDILLLDEPTAGVDPQSRNHIFDGLERLRDQGMALLYTTHYMEEVERLADHIVIVDQGRVVARGSLRELTDLVPSTQVLHMSVDGWPSVTGLEAIGGVRSINQGDGSIAVGIDTIADAGGAVLRHLATAGIDVRHVTTGRVTLEDVFLSLTGRQLRDSAS